MSKVTTRKISAVPVSSSKTLRDLSYKPRFRHNYGSDETFYQFISNYKDKWEKSLYYVDEALVRSELEKDNLTPPQFDTIAVSYTHLDVYKRQIFGFTIDSYMDNVQEQEKYPEDKGDDIPVEVSPVSHNKLHSSKVSGN